MSEELGLNVLDTENKQVEQAPQDALLNLAVAYGYDPEKGEKTPEDFIKYALDGRKKVREKNKEINEMRIVVDQLANDLKKQKEVAFNQAKAELEAQKQNAIQNGNYQEIKHLELQEKQLEKDQLSDPAREAIFEDFRMRNSDWIDGDSFADLEIQGYAETIEKALLRKNLSPSEHVARLEDAILAKFPDYFKSNKNNAIDVEPVQEDNNVVAKTKRKKTFTINDLTDAQKLGAKYMSDRGHMTVEQYIEKLVENGDLV